MSTIYVFQAEVPALGAVPASDDVLLVYDTSAGRTKSITAALLSESQRTVTAGTTSGAFAASGITTVSTLATVATLVDPTQAGQETTILFPLSTATHTVSAVAALIFGSTGGNELVGASRITKTGTSDGFASSITLVAQTTAKWFIKSLVTNQSTTAGPGGLKTT